VSVAPHAEPFFATAQPDEASGRRVGVLLSHGFTGSPASMVPWGRHLAAHGFGVAVPRLPGHGTTWQEMNRTGWEDWYDELQRAFEKLKSEHDDVVVGGLSMGGGLVLKLAADRAREISGVMLVNAAVHLNNKQLLAVPVLKHLIPSMPGVVNDIKKPGQDEHGYSRTPLKALHSMLGGWKGLREDLAKVTQPIVHFRSAEDHVVDPSSSQIIASKVSSLEVHERILENSYHVATLDNDAPAIFEESVEFIRRVTTRQ
jgi:carboxylesterase